MTEPGSAGTAMVAGSVFGLESNSPSLRPLQGCYQISGGWDYQWAFQKDCFGEGPEGKGKERLRGQRALYFVCKGVVNVGRLDSDD